MDITFIVCKRCKRDMVWRSERDYRSLPEHLLYPQKSYRFRTIWRWV